MNFGKASNPPRWLPARRGFLSLLVLAAAALAAGLALSLSGSGPAPKPTFTGAVPAPSIAAPASDPLAYTPARAADYSARASLGLAHVLYAKSPGGIIASVARSERYRRQIAAVAARARVDPDTLEAIVLLESAGRPDAVAGSSLADAAGLTQIVAGTAQQLLGLRVDVAASTRLTLRLEHYLAIGKRARAARAARQRMRVDPRFDPAQALAATGRYLDIALARFGRMDLAVESYHMGIGNLETALRDYSGAGAGTPIASVVRDGELSYAKLFFDSTPLQHASAWRLLYSLGDDSETYYWRVLAARQMILLYRHDPAALRAQAALQTARASAEEVLHPPAATLAFAHPSDLAAAARGGAVVALPARALAADGIAIDRRLGALASKLGQSPALYRALRPAALAVLGYIGAKVQAITGAGKPLLLSGAVSDGDYERALAGAAGTQSAPYPLETTGYAFDIRRSYASRAQAVAFQSALDRLTALNLIAWERTPTELHVTVAADAASALGVPATRRPPRGVGSPKHDNSA